MRVVARFVATRQRACGFEEFGGVVDGRPSSVDPYAADGVRVVA